ncbi:MAG: MBOAT family protein [Bacteroidales bacterium]|nr:MBOAT family protein [Bacteroidales bacterium]
MNEFLTYLSSDPFLFTNIKFWVFFVFVLGVYAIIFRKKKLRNAFLFAASLFFYYKSAGYFFVLLLFSTVTDYSFGIAINHFQKKWKRKFFLIASLAVNLLVLSYFKYAYYFTDIFNQIFGTDFVAIDYLALWTNQLTGSDLDIWTIILPVGVSFYTFQTMSYVIDVYRRKAKPIRSIIDFGFYVTFFPPLVAGPIVRAAEFVPQLYRNYQLSSREFSFAVFLIVSGLIKKMLIADYISINFVDRVFENPLLYTGFENLMAAYGYAIQIYCDFSGYTDIAIGTALILGFQLPINFRSPYKAKNISDFWRRWHISLSSWLRDYLYIPLGGSRNGKIVMFLALMLTMLLGGLWHGAATKFVIWGGLHGLALVAHKIWTTYLPNKNPRKKQRFKTVVSIFITFNFVCFAWLFFRADSMQTVETMLSQMTYRMFDVNILTMISNYAVVLFLILLGFVMHWLPENIKENYRSVFHKIPIVLKVILVLCVILFLYQIKSADLQPFIYFQF